MGLVLILVSWRESLLRLKGVLMVCLSRLAATNKHRVRSYLNKNMLIIRLQRVGKKNQPSYRVVLTEKAYPVKGKFIEILGHYNPRLKTKSLNKERILYWLSQGAQTSPTVHNLLVDEKVIDVLKVKAWRPKKKKEAEKEIAGEGAAKESIEGGAEGVGGEEKPEEGKDEQTQQKQEESLETSTEKEQQLSPEEQPSSEEQQS